MTVFYLPVDSVSKSDVCLIPVQGCSETAKQHSPPVGQGNLHLNPAKISSLCINIRYFSLEYESDLTFFFYLGPTSTETSYKLAF